jgi:hypothetical protein
MECFELTELILQSFFNVVVSFVFFTIICDFILFYVDKYLLKVIFFRDSPTFLAEIASIDTFLLSIYSLDADYSYLKSISL